MNNNIFNVSKSCQIPGLDKIYQDYFGDKKDGYFVDVGAYDGDTFSNTSGLAMLGWRGIMIEPDLGSWLLLHKSHESYPHISVLNCAVSDFTGKTKLYTAGTAST